MQVHRIRFNYDINCVIQWNERKGGGNVMFVRITELNFVEMMIIYLHRRGKYRVAFVKL